MGEGRPGPRGPKGDKGDKGDAAIVELRDLLRGERNRWRKWFAALAAIVLAIGFVWRQEAVNDCQARNDFGRILREIVEEATEPDSRFRDFVEVRTVPEECSWW